MLILHLDNLYSNDMELRLLLKSVWPNITKKTLDRVIPKRPQGKSRLLIRKKIVFCDLVSLITCLSVTTFG